MAVRTHLIDIDGVTSSIKLADVYDATGSDIGTVIGISRVNSDTVIPANTRPISQKDALRNGLLAKLRIRYSSTTNGGRARYGSIICPIDKAFTAMTQLEGKSYRGGTVTNVSVPQQARYT